MNIPTVRACDACECAYNTDCKCHAFAITVGDGLVAHCDTFCLSAVPGGDAAYHAEVGACKVERCVHNRGLTCHAHTIKVGHLDGEVRCLSYRAA